MAVKGKFYPLYISEIRSITDLMRFCMHLCACGGHRETDVGIEMLLLEDTYSNPFQWNCV